MTLDSSVILTLDNSVYIQYMLKGEAFIQYPGRSLLFLLDRIKKEVCCPLAALQPYCDHEKHHMKTKPTPKNGTVARWKKTGSVGKKNIALLTLPVFETVVLLNFLLREIKHVFIFNLLKSEFLSLAYKSILIDNGSLPKLSSLIAYQVPCSTEIYSFEFLCSLKSNQ